MDTPAGLVRKHCPERTVVLSSDREDLRAILERVPHLQSMDADRTGSSPGEGTLSLRGQGEDFVSEVIHCLSENSVRVTDFHTVIPTLEDVFLKLTDRSIRD